MKKYEILENALTWKKQVAMTDRHREKE